MRGKLVVVVGAVAWLMLLSAFGSVHGQACGQQVNFETSCPQGTCCSRFGFCGSTDFHCDVNQGCQDNCTRSADLHGMCGDRACNIGVLHCTSTRCLTSAS